MAKLKIPVEIKSDFLIKVVRGVTASPEFNETTSDDYKKGFFDFAETLVKTLEKIGGSGKEEATTMTQFDKLKQMNTDEAAVFISAIADSCKDVARYGNQTIPHLVKILLESEV